MRTTRSIVLLTLVVVNILGLTGCAFTIKNTDGLAEAYKDIDQASSYASELKSMPGIPDQNKSEAKDLYIKAKSELDSYLRKAITDASDYEVNNPKEEYQATNGTAKVNAFADKVKELRGTRIKTIPAWAAPVTEIAIKEIWDLNQQAREEGRKRFEDTVTKYLMKQYEEIPGGKNTDK